MNKSSWSLRGLLSVAALVATICAVGITPAHAQSTGSGAIPFTVPNVRSIGYTETLLAATIATTTETDFLSLTFTPVNDPTAYSIQGYFGGAGFSTPRERARIWWSADVTKATGTTGHCGVYVNGALVSTSKRFSASAAGQNTISGVWDGALTTAGSQVIKLQCASADTSVFTVSNASLYAQEAF